MPTWKVKVIVPQDFREGKKKKQKRNRRKLSAFYYFHFA